jgi:hypothetical protein
MLRYTAVNEANQVQRRLKRNTYDRAWGDINHSRDGDTLALFTLKPQGLVESEANLDWVLGIARNLGQSLVVFKPNQIQIAGRHSSEAVATHVWPREWLQAHGEWLDASNQPAPRMDHSEQGEVVEFYSHRPCFAMQEHQGIYDVASGRRLTNRQEIIERMWQLGFAAQRGRPLSIARIRWTGNREELEHVTRLADQYRNREYHSDVAKKLVSAFRSINRYAAWPGSW